MFWCETAADALLLLSFERQAGHSAMLLWDLDVGGIHDKADGGSHVVLSSHAYSDI